MKDREKLGFFDGFEAYKQKRETNRQTSYENKVCKKIITRLFRDDATERATWMTRLEDSNEPLAELQHLISGFCLGTNRIQIWSINDLLGPPAKLAALPLRKEFSDQVAACSKEDKTQIPAMAFYNSVIAQDMVIHIGLATKMPNGYFRLVRSSTSGDGGVVIDTLDGFLEMLSGK